MPLFQLSKEAINSLSKNKVKTHSSKKLKLITLIEPLFKIVEEIYDYRIENYIEDTNQFHPHQYDFRSGRLIQDVIFIPQLIYRVRMVFEDIFCIWNK